ncbi:hypothetical protein [Corynebacterium meitnerae]|uniref:Uncharacterized protein n=1 Tax=Corynebacterium meitnerae TaxID=2913498 RepID=A0A9X3RL12_9CORY|nr:hypothetical protein [Corynebacterium meitnerae]MCZ9293403.1 hypothetical protein [Corynebacterium meitnerae]
MLAATWRGHELIDVSGLPLATFSPTDNTLDMAGATPITVVHTAGAMRWEVSGTAAGETYTVRTHGFGVRTLTARCGSRSYQLERTGRMSKKRTVTNAAGAVIAETAPRGLQDLVVTPTAAAASVPLADLVFLSWALTLIDTPARQTMI